MIYSVWRNQLRQAFRDGRLAVLYSLLVILAAASCISGWVDFRTQHATAQEENEEARDHWEAQDAKNPHSALHYGVYVFKEPGAASLFDPGVDAYAGTSVFIEAHYKNDATDQPVRDRTSLARFGNLSPAFFLTHLVPLILILMHFGDIAGERNGGTLRAVAATGITGRRWLLGKWLAAWTTPLVGLVLTLLGAMVLSTSQDGSLATWAALGLGYLLYLGSIVNVTLLVSARARTTTAALMILLSLWMLGGMALPRLTANIADRLYPTPLVQHFEQVVDGEKKAGIDAAIAQAEQDTLTQYQVDNTADLPVNWDAIRMQQDEVFTDQINDRHYDELYAAQRSQQQVFRMSALVWPMMAARLQSMTLSRTGLADQHHFNQSTETYRRAFVKLLNDDMMNNSRTGDWGYSASAETWADVPDFHYEERPTATVMGEAALDLGILAVWFLLSGAGLLVVSKNLFRSNV